MVDGEQKNCAPRNATMVETMVETSFEMRGVLRRIENMLVSVVVIYSAYCRHLVVVFFFKGVIVFPVTM